MAPSPLQQRRRHNTLLFQKLLNLRDGASPFTLILDTLEQSGASIVREFVRRAKIGKSKIIFISFASLRKKLSFQPDIFVSATAKPLSVLRAEILSHLPPPSAQPASSTQKYLLIIDSLHPLATRQPQHLSQFLTSLLLSPLISLLATYHTDIPIPISTPNHSPNPYAPTPLSVLTHLSTALLTPLSLPHLIIQKHARDKSLQPPSFSISEYKEGILVSLGRGEKDGREGEIVVEMEIRRRSGRGISEIFVLSPPLSSPRSSSESSTPTPGNSKQTLNLSTITLLLDHPLYTTIPPSSLAHNQAQTAEEEVATTFNLGLTEKQRRDREGVVLPYFDAQKGEGPGEGGRILYEMGDEDREDFDDEEDEI